MCQTVYEVTVDMEMFSSHLYVDCRNRCKPCC